MMTPIREALNVAVYLIKRCARDVLASVRSLFLPSFKRDVRLKKEANALRGGETRLSVRTDKAAVLAFIEANRRAFYEKGRPGQAPFCRLFARKIDAMTLLS